MSGRNCKWLTVGVVLLGAAIVGPAEASAHGLLHQLRPAYWWSAPYYSIGYFPSYPAVSCCDPCGFGDGEWYLGMRPGPVRRLLFGPYRWYYGAGCSTCGLDACCCEAVSSVSPSDTPTEAPTRPMPGPALESDAPEPPKTPPAGTPNRSTTSAAGVHATASDVGQLTVHVPDDADVFINGLETTSRGTRRTYLSEGLKPGCAYDYEVRVQIRRNGTLLEEVHQVRLTAGAQKALAVDFKARPAAEIARLQ